MDADDLTSVGPPKWEITPSTQTTSTEVIVSSLQTSLLHMDLRRSAINHPCSLHTREIPTIYLSQTKFAYTTSVCVFNWRLPRFAYLRSSTCKANCVWKKTRKNIAYKQTKCRFDKRNKWDILYHRVKPKSHFGSRASSNCVHLFFGSSRADVEVSVDLCRLTSLLKVFL